MHAATTNEPGLAGARTNSCGTSFYVKQGSFHTSTIAPSTAPAHLPTMFRKGWYTAVGKVENAFLNTSKEGRRGKTL